MNFKDNLTVSIGIIQILVIIGGFGYTFGDQRRSAQAQAERIDRMENQLLIWLEDAEDQAEKNHLEVMGEIDKNRRKINNTNNFLIRKFPEYQTYD